MRSAGLEAEIKRMKYLKEPIDSAAEKLEEYVRSCMVNAKMDKLDLGIFGLTLRKASQIAEAVDESKIPDKYFKTIPETKQLVKSELLKDLKEGVKIEGAKLGEGKRALLIK